MAKKKKNWIQKAVKRKGRVHRYLMRKYGKKAFTKDGKIKTKYLNKAIEVVKNSNMDNDTKRSLLSALVLAKSLKKMSKKEKKKLKRRLLLTALTLLK